LTAVSWILAVRLVNKKSSRFGFEWLLEKVYHFLSFRPRSEKEIRDYLEKQHASDLTIRKVIDKLRKQKLVDDEAFADWWLEQRGSFRPKGKIALKAELKWKGIDREIINRLLEVKVDEILLAKRAIKDKNISVRKLAAYLTRRGFTWSTITAVLEERRKKE